MSSSPFQFRLKISIPRGVKGEDKNELTSPGKGWSRGFRESGAVCCLLTSEHEAGSPVGSRNPHAGSKGASLQLTTFKYRTSEPRHRESALD